MWAEKVHILFSAVAAYTVHSCIVKSETQSSVVGWDSAQWSLSGVHRPEGSCLELVITLGCAETQSLTLGGNFF